MSAHFGVFFTFILTTCLWGRKHYYPWKYDFLLLLVGKRSTGQAMWLATSHTGIKADWNTCLGKHFNHSFLLKIETALVAAQGACDGTTPAAARSFPVLLWSALGQRFGVSEKVPVLQLSKEMGQTSAASGRTGPVPNPCASCGTCEHALCHGCRRDSPGSAVTVPGAPSQGRGAPSQARGPLEK